MRNFSEQPVIPGINREPLRFSFLATINASVARNFGLKLPFGHRLVGPILGCRVLPSLPGKPCIAAGFPRFRTLICMIAVLTVGVLPFSFVAAGKSTSQGFAPATSAWASYIAEASRRFDVPASWIRAVLQLESTGDNRALSPKGAMGLMQIMPGTFAELQLRYHLGTDPYAPRDNILAGAAHLREMHDRYGPAGFLAAYNAGPNRYEEYLTRGRPLPDETRNYVAALAPIIGVPALPRYVENTLPPAPLPAVAAAHNREAAPAKGSENGFSPKISPFERRSGTRTRMLFVTIHVAFEHTLASARVVDMTALEWSASRALRVVSASAERQPDRIPKAAQSSLKPSGNTLFAVRLGALASKRYHDRAERFVAALSAVFGAALEHERQGWWKAR